MLLGTCTWLTFLAARWNPEHVQSAVNFPVGALRLSKRVIQLAELTEMSLVPVQRGAATEDELAGLVDVQDREGRRVTSGRLDELQAGHSISVSDAPT